MLLGMMSRFTTADVVVVGMIGERGREVGEFAKTVLDQDQNPVLPLWLCRRIARLFCESAALGVPPPLPNITAIRARMLLIMDSLTRVAHARREIGLALGEQPTAKGYPPSWYR